MPPTTPKLTTAVEEYYSDLCRVWASGGATGEKSYYPALSNLLNAVGSALRPQVFCISELAEEEVQHFTDAARLIAEIPGLVGEG